MLNAKINVKRLKTCLLFRLRFRGILTSCNTVRIDVSLKNKALLGFDLKNYVPDYVDIRPFSLKILKLKEMVAEKIHSLLARKNARDLYDLFFLLRISEFVSLIQRFSEFSDTPAKRGEFFKSLINTNIMRIREIPPEKLDPKKFIEEKNGKVLLIKKYEFQIPWLFKFHEKPKYTYWVDLYVIEKI